MRTLLIDNYDSFTYNLFQLLAEVNGVEPVVVRNDEASWEELARLRFDNVVLSPGPGRPDVARDFGVCVEAIRHCEAPLLGVCLGHQGIGWVHGGRVVPASEPLHGRVRAVEHAGAGLFAGIPRRFEATRYHSLCLESPLPSELEAIAWAEDGAAMALAHRSRPQWGVQFHPESIATEHGQRLLANFRDLTTAAPVGRCVAFFPDSAKKSTQQRELRLATRRLDQAIDAGQVFKALYGESESAFWLDSSRPGPGARFSFMSAASGPLAATIVYDVDVGEVTVRRGRETEIRSESIFDYLERELELLRPLAADLPFDFDCGFAGYLGYELKADCGAPNAHRSPHPDAAFIFADRLLAFDHEQGHVYLLCLHEPGGEAQAEEWLDATSDSLAALTALEAGPASGEAGEDSTEPPRCCSDESSPASPPSARSGEPSPSAPTQAFRLARSRQQYLDDIRASIALLREGESYEICLTDSIAAAVDTDPLALYMELRRINPAPFAAYLRFGDLALLSSSPERFLSLDADGGVEAKPIKGTSARGASPEEDAALAAALREDEKNRAENLMIVDLLRNDLGSVCAVGSVEVPGLMEVESFATVHQLVSTVRGCLRPGASTLDCVRACFPPGSMTGAPKLRTMEILDRLEGRARGPYSGAIGYFGLGGGADLSVTIRTVVVDRGEATIGAGGAIVLDSEPEREWEEMLLKARAPLRAIDPGADPASISLDDPRRAAVEPLPASAPDLTS
ncbi:MAG TPA: aminodeoxychorismate synthase component I [Solirubrobacterales bacterium]|jgi:para-aminobenzoate synthetase|nr:aminodeoxychorismate synthase component I [Solirubrobacterales bacterium]